MAFTEYMSKARFTLGHLRKANRSRLGVLFVDKEWEHHIRRSGYHLLCEGIGYPLPSEFSILPRRMEDCLVSATLNGYWEQQVLLRFAIWRGGFKHLHINNGDFCRWPVSPRPGFRGITTSATFHQPPDVLMRVVPLYRRGEIDVAIAVARCQIPYLEDVFGTGNVRYVPHGVDTTYFAPPSDRRNRADLVICVGAHRRDFGTFAKTASLIRKHRPKTRVVLIAPRKRLPDWVSELGIEIRFDISDEELRETYRQASVQLLPLEASTANNAALEGMASGLPLVTTDIEGISDYVHPDWCISCPKEHAEAHAEAVLRILENDDKREEMSRNAREHALKYDWALIRRQFLEVLHEAASRQVAS